MSGDFGDQGPGSFMPRQEWAVSAESSYTRRAIVGYMGVELGSPFKLLGGFCGANTELRFIGYYNET